MSASRPDGPELRIGDAEREAAVSALGEHYASGRLTKDEYDERSEAAYAARTRSALHPLFADLPRPEGEPAASRRPTSGPRPADRGPRWRGGLMPVLVVVIAIAVLTHLPLVLLAVVLWVLVAKVMHLWGHSHGRTSWHQHHHPHR